MKRINSDLRSVLKAIRTCTPKVVINPGCTFNANIVFACCRHKVSHIRFRKSISDAQAVGLIEPNDPSGFRYRLTREGCQALADLKVL